MYKSKGWTEAKEDCEHEGDKLAVPKTQVIKFIIRPTTPLTDYNLLIIITRDY